MTKSNQGAFEGASSKEKLIGVSIIAVPLALLVALAFAFLHPDPIKRETVLGCYVAKGSPALDVQPDHIRIVGSNRSFDYVAEPAKEGYRLSVRPSLSLRPVGVGRYAFIQDRRGIGYFWPLLTLKSDDPQSMREPNEYGGRFQIIAMDSQLIIYSRVAAIAGCS